MGTQYAAHPHGVPSPAWIGRWVHAALRHANGRRAAPSAPGRICVRIVTAAESRRLNRTYRGRNEPTNVLSFPASPVEQSLAGSLGDLVICASVVTREAREQRKPLTAHWAHMVVHGTLHLLGHDHVKPRPARRMESLEVEILRGFGYHDPYRTADRKA